MRFLKIKIQKAQEALQRRLAKSKALSKVQNESSPLSKFNENVRQSNERVKGLRSWKIKPEMQEKFVCSSTKKENTKNIAVNYATAIRIFAVSPLATPYIQEKLENEAITREEFIAFIENEKFRIGGISSFRERLLVDKKDNAKTVSCKGVFQWVAEVFIKCFSVNWIMNGRMAQKETYLKYRFKMLRRIRNPEAFTYIKHRIYIKKTAERSESIDL